MSRTVGLVALAALAACQGSDPQPLELVTLDPYGDAASLVAGGGGSSVVGYTSSAASYLPGVRFVRHDAADPDQVEPIGAVALAGGATITRLHVGDEAAALIVAGAVKVVDLSVPSLPLQPISVPGAPVDVAVSGRWVAVAVDHGLVLALRDAPFTTVQHAAASTPTALLATAAGFLVFTATGYVAVDTSGAAPAFQESSDELLRDLRAGVVSGTRAMVAGPDASPGRSRVLLLDLTDPAAPAVDAGCEVRGDYVAFAWDGAAASVIAIHGDGDDARPGSFHQGYLVSETSEGLQATGVPLTFWSQGAQPLAAHAGRLFAAQAGGVALLRIR